MPQDPPDPEEPCSGFAVSQTSDSCPLATLSLPAVLSGPSSSCLQTVSTSVLSAEVLQCPSQASSKLAGLRTSPRQSSAPAKSLAPAESPPLDDSPVTADSPVPDNSPVLNRLPTPDESPPPHDSPVSGQAPLPGDLLLYDPDSFLFTVPPLYLSASEGHEGADQMLYGVSWPSPSRSFPCLCLGCLVLQILLRVCLLFAS